MAFNTSAHKARWWSLPTSLLEKQSYNFQISTPSSLRELFRPTLSGDNRRIPFGVALVQGQYLRLNSLPTRVLECVLSSLH
ncbi:hypothetical protein TNCV_4148001 [Trichonephila clavipes]|nr:hypothetical protein TNCV_4148001 [Trichonephila clavipes]